jgi:hypothetical protein
LVALKTRLVKSSIVSFLISVNLTSAAARATEVQGPVAATGFPGDEFFKTSYEACRENFLKNLNGWPPSTEHEIIPISQGDEKDLFMDSVYIPSTSGKKERLLILTSGVHGIEGFTGSALQTAALKENFWGLRDEDLGILILHAVNPYGFKHQRRVTANNVDLNRNLDTTPQLFQNKNEGYQTLRGLFNPSVPASSGFFHRVVFYLESLYAIFKHSLSALKSAILKGQYEFSDSLFFGGTQFEPQKEILERLLLKYGTGYSQVLLIDVHTGYGARGKLHLFADQSPEMDTPYIEKIFAGQKLDYGKHEDFYKVTGSFVAFAAKLLKGKTRFAPMVFEFGTLDSQKTLGAVDSIYRLSAENQLFQHKAETPEDEQKIHDLFRELFYPSAPEWREAALTQFKNSLTLALKNQKSAAQ